jgi:hypothetical protein
MAIAGAVTASAAANAAPVRETFKDARPFDLNAFADASPGIEANGGGFPDNTYLVATNGANCPSEANCVALAGSGGTTPGELHPAQALDASGYEAIQIHFSHQGEPVALQYNTSGSTASVGDNNYNQTGYTLNGNGGEVIVSLGNDANNSATIQTHISHTGVYEDQAYIDGFYATGIPINDGAGVTIDDQSPAIGDVLTATVNDPDGVTNTVTYSWTSNSGSGTDSNTYTVVPGDAGGNISVQVTYQDDDGYDENESAATSGSVPVNTSPGSIGAITGSTTEGETLTAGTVTDDDGVGSLTYQWKSNGTDTGSDQNTYITGSGDVDNTITVEVSYTDGVGFPETAVSAGFGPIVAAFSNSPASLSIDNDSPTVGSTLTASLTDADGVPAGVDYVWTSASGGETNTSGTYEVVAGDVDDTISVAVAFTDDEGTAESPSAETANTVPLGNSPASVSISGNAEVNSPVTAEITDPDGYTNPSLNNASFTWTLDGADQADGNNCSAATCFPAAEGELVVTVSYTDNNGFDETDITSAAVTVAAEGSGTGGGGGTNPPVAPSTGCNYNPMSRSFDMLFILMAGAGFLYLRSRRRQTVEGIDA